MTGPSAISWVVAQQQRYATERAAQQDAQRAAFNPRPPGQIVEGSASSIVLRFLQGHPRVSFRYAELLKHTGCTPSALVWACSFLVKQGMIDALPDALSGRQRYRYVWMGVHRRTAAGAKQKP